MNILVLGGTRYFGKRLVDLLLEQGHSVVIATRGLTKDSFGERVERRIADRGDPRAMASLSSTQSWDIIFDQSCYSPNEAAISSEVFRGRVGRYVYTSTASVYKTFGNRPEADFDPLTHLIRSGGRSDFEYGEAKRIVEAIYFQKASFPVVAMRIPIVLGPDDYTGRLEFHIDRVREGKPIVVPNLSATSSFVQSSEAARFLLWLGENTFTGPINACSDGVISIQEILEQVEQRVGKKARVLSEGRDEDTTPLIDSQSKSLDTTRAKDLGFRFDLLGEWFPGLVATLSSRTSS